MDLINLHKLMDNLTIIRKYYQSFADKDRKTLESILAPDLKFISSYASYNNSKEMLEAIWQHVLENENTLRNLEIFENENQYMVMYELETPEIVWMSEYLNIDNGFISEIKVFVGPKG